MAGIKIGSLPGVFSATLADVIPANQSGITVQETLMQLLNLFVLINAGNPNGSVVGVIGQLCFDTSNNVLWVSTSFGTVWTTVYGTFTNGQIPIGSTGNAPVPATLTAGDNIAIINSSGTITISATGLAGFGWTVVTGTSQAMLSNNGYIPNNASLVTLTLPVTSSVGAEIDIIGKGAGGWLIAQNSGQSIVLGSSTTTTGVSGSLASTNSKDSFYMICTVANTEWTVGSGPESSGLTVV